MENTLDQEGQVPTVGIIADMDLTKVIEFIRSMFKSDIEDTNQGEFIVAMPAMEHRCAAIIRNMFDPGIKIIPTMPNGTCIALGFFVESFAKCYGEIINPELTFEDNYKLLIEGDKKTKKGLNVWYFQLRLQNLEKLLNPNFVDLRPEFHKLYHEYQDLEDHAAGLIKIDAAVKKYKNY